MRWIALFLLLMPLVPASVWSQGPLDSLILRAEQDSNDAVAHFDLAKALLAEEEWDSADSALREAVLLAPSYGDAWIQIALLPERRGARYRRQLDKDGQLDSVRTEADRARRRAWFSDPLTELELFAIIEDDLLRPSLRQYAGDWYNVFARSIHRLSDGKRAEAWKEIDRIARMRGHPLFGSVITRLHGLLAWSQQDYPTAITDFMSLTARAYAAETLGFLPMLAANEDRYALATLLLQAGSYNESMLTYQRVVELDASVWQAHVQLARMYEASEMWLEAVAERRTAVAVNPDDASLLVELGGTLLNAGERAEALQVLREAEAHLPRDPRLYLLLGLALTEPDEAASRRAALTHFVAIAPSRMAPQVSAARAILDQPSPATAARDSSDSSGP